VTSLARDDGRWINARRMIEVWPAFGRHLPDIIALLCSGYFLCQALYFAHTQSVILDEGLYLYKGLLFITGRYEPYQAYGPWTNHMPLSFLIPGVVQRLFGPGLRTGRYFAVFLGMLLVLGLWIAANRLGGRWWAAGAVAALALNPFFARIYSHAKAEVLGACMLIWVLVLVLGEDRRPWQFILGSSLAGVLAMTRMNLGLALPFVLAYVFWQHGFEQGLISSVAGIAPVILGHMLFWPGILELWASQLPSAVSPFLDAWRSSGIESELPGAVPGFTARVTSLFQGVRFNLVAYIGVLASLFFWPGKGDWRKGDRRKSSLLLVSLFAGFLLFHGWASLSKDYCVYCFRTYNAYFTPAALLVPISLSGSWRKSRSPRRTIFTVFVLIIVSAGVGFAGFEDVGDSILATYMSSIGNVEQSWLSRALTTQFGLTFTNVRRVTPIVFAVIVSGLGQAGLFFTWRRLALSDRGISSTRFIWVAGMAAALALSPTRVLGNGYREYDCGGDILTRYEEVGRSLADSIPSGSLVYWRVDSPTLLLYIPDVSIFPQQLNDGANFNSGGSADEMARLGLWNQELAERWFHAADLVLVDRSSLGGLEARFPTSELRELWRTPKLEGCRRGTRISVLSRID
jgi:hypothetical protein